MDKIVVAPVVNMHATPHQGSEVISQATYGERVAFLREEGPWSRIETGDGYVGWTQVEGLIDTNGYWESPSIRATGSLKTHLYSTPDTSPHPPLLSLPFGTPLKLTTPLDHELPRWVAVELIDGSAAWVQKGDLCLNCSPRTLAEILTLSKEFLGLPYTWGGRSSFGFDCSGFIQTLFRQMGITLPRDAYLQAKSPLLKQVDTPQPGDLLFFGEERIIHVGLHLGDGQFIHAGVRDGAPKVTISQLSTTLYPHLSTFRLRR